MMRRLLLACLVFLACASAAHAGTYTYIVPMWGVAGGGWYPLLTITNPNGTPVTIHTVRGYPMVTTHCLGSCSDPPPPLVLDTSGPRTFLPTWYEGNDYVTAGAFIIETDAPVRIDTVYFGPNVVQPLDIARTWLPAGTHVATIQEGQRLNAIVTNPNAFGIEVSIWRNERQENEVRVAVPPYATRMVTLPPGRCGDELCFYPDWPPPPVVVSFESPAPFLASVSSISASQAFFSLAGTR